MLSRIESDRAVDVRVRFEQGDRSPQGRMLVVLGRSFHPVLGKSDTVLAFFRHDDGGDRLDFLIWVEMSYSGPDIRYPVDSQIIRFTGGVIGHKGPVFVVFHLPSIADIRNFEIQHVSCEDGAALGPLVRIVRIVRTRVLQFIYDRKTVVIGIQDAVQIDLGLTAVS